MKPSDKNKILSGEEIFKLIDQNQAEKISALDDFEREAAEGLKMVKNRDRLKKIHERIDEELKEKKKHRGIIFWMSAAASLVLVVGLIYLIAPHFKKVNEVAAADANKTSQETPIITSDEKLSPKPEEKEISITATDSVSATSLFPREENTVKALEKNADEEKLKTDKSGYFKTEDLQDDQQLSSANGANHITDKKVLDEESANSRNYKKEEGKQKPLYTNGFPDNAQSNMGTGVNQGTFELKKEERESQTKNPNVVINGGIAATKQATTNPGSNTGSNFATTISTKENAQKSSPKKDFQNNNNRQAVNNEHVDNNFGLAGTTSPYLQSQDDRDKHEDIVEDQVVVTEQNKNVTATGNNEVTTSPMYNPSAYHNALAENKNGKKNAELDEKAKDNKKKTKEQSETQTQQAVTINQGVNRGDMTSGEPVIVGDTTIEIAPLTLSEIELAKSPQVNEEKFDELKSEAALTGNSKPQFPGGADALHKFFHDNIKMPAADKNVSGKVDVSFAIGKDGSVSDIRILKAIKSCDACTKEVIRVVKLMPKWKPATSGGKPVTMRYNLPVKF